MITEELLTQLRRFVIFFIGVTGLLIEFTREGDVRVPLLVTDLVLIGIVPIEMFVSSHTGHGGGK